MTACTRNAALTALAVVRVHLVVAVAGPVASTRRNAPVLALFDHEITHVTKGREVRMRRIPTRASDLIVGAMDVFVNVPLSKPKSRTSMATVA